MLQLYDLAGADPAHRFSPHCWKVHMALAHKGLPYEGRPWRFTETDALAFSGQGKVPVLVDGDKTVVDSFAIAEHLEDRFPDFPSLFGGPGGRATARFVNHWADATIVGGVAPMIIADVLQSLAPSDQAYFRETREKRFGQSLESLQATRAERLPRFRQSLGPLRQMLLGQPFVGGRQPYYADYCVFGGFQWARTCSGFELLEPDDPVAAWCKRLLGAFDGMAARAVLAATA